MMKTIFFDWNGTLLDDLVVSIEAINGVLKKRGMKTLDSIEDYHAVFGFPVKNYYRRLGFDFEKESFEIVGQEFMDSYMELAKKCTLTKGAEELVQSLKNKGYRCVILSASRKENLLYQAQCLRCDSWFDDIIGIDNIYAASKIKVAENWIKDHYRAEEKLYFIGDTLHDKETAEAIGARCILISSGHSNKNTLISAGVDVVDTFEEIEAIIEG